MDFFTGWISSHAQESGGDAPTAREKDDLDVIGFAVMLALCDATRAARLCQIPRAFVFVFAIAAAATVGLAAQPKRALQPADLANFTYELGEGASVDDGKVPLKDGRWTDAADGGSTFVLDQHHALGDLDGDGVADAASIVIEHSTGSGTFFYLFGLLSRDGRPVQAGPPEWLGDRSVIERLSIDRKGILSVRYLTHKDSDRECCPTLRIEDRYRIEQGILTGITK
jgi:hypothetical protein